MFANLDADWLDPIQTHHFMDKFVDESNSACNGTRVLIKHLKYYHHVYASKCPSSHGVYIFT